MAAPSTPEPRASVLSPPGQPQVAATLLDNTPDSEKVRRCLQLEATDALPADVKEELSIQPDRFLGSTHQANACQNRRTYLMNSLCWSQVTPGRAGTVGGKVCREGCHGREAFCSTSGCRGSPLCLGPLCCWEWIHRLCSTCGERRRHGASEQRQ